MKKITTYSLLLLFLTLTYSCVKEVDMITEGDLEVIPQEGETRLITGLVKDTSGIIIPDASVKIILDDLELETEADENGEWNLIVPNSLTEGFVVANKIEYSKSIQRFKESEDNRIEDIYLAREQSNAELNLGFDPSNLKIVTGRIVDEMGNAIPDVLLLLFSQLESPSMEYVSNGIATTGVDGTFEIIYEDLGFISTTLFSLFSGGCSDNLTVPVQGQDPVEDLGDVELSYDNFAVFQTSLESDGSNCYDNVRTLAYVYDLEGAFTENSYDQPLGAISLEYCLNEDEAVYIGVESEDNVHFNGLFVSPTDAAPSYQFDICTPNPGNFLELNINGTVEVHEDNLYYVDPGIVASENTGAALYFKVMNWVIYTPTGSDHPAYQIGKTTILTLGAINEDQYSLDEDNPFNYVNIVQDDDSYYAGIVQAKLKAEDGSPADIAIRFRVSK